MNENQRNLIKWAECMVCDIKDEGILRDDYENWAIPSKDHWKRTSEDWITLLRREGSRKFISRESHFLFIEKHWKCDTTTKPVISRQKFDEYWDNDNHRGVWPFEV